MGGAGIGQWGSWLLVRVDVWKGRSQGGSVCKSSLTIVY